MMEFIRHLDQTRPGYAYGAFEPTDEQIMDIIDAELLPSERAGCGYAPLIRLVRAVFKWKTQPHQTRERSPCV